METSFALCNIHILESCAQTKCCFKKYEKSWLFKRTVYCIFPSYCLWGYLMGLGTQQALSQVKNDFETSSSDNSSCCSSSESSSSLLCRDGVLVWTEDRSLNLLLRRLQFFGFYYSSCPGCQSGSESCLFILCTAHGVFE